MTTFFIFGFILVLAFALALSAYLTFYKLKITNVFAQGITFIALATINTLVTLILVIIAIWPAY